MNRQILYLRPDPARVVVRPFKPATEPRDLNPTDKTRANHIVGRVLQLDAAAAAQQLSDVVENFEGRHRNLLDIFETRAAEMVMGGGKVLLSTLDGSAIGQDSNLVVRPDEGVIIAPANSSHRRGQCLILTQAAMTLDPGT
jgi:hypothetical protein